MVSLKYISLITKKNIEYYLSIIEDEPTKRNFINTVSKLDVRISTNLVIVGDEFYYKIWIVRKGTKKKAHIKQYYSLELLNKKLQSSITLAEILAMVRLNADIPDDFEEYCEIRFLDPTDDICRRDYLYDLIRAKRFKKFLTQEEIKSIPFLPIDTNINNNIKDEETNFFDLNNESFLKKLNYSIIYLEEKREYDKLSELKSTLEYHAKIIESYGYDPYTGDFDEKKFPITKEDKHMDKIDKDFKNYFNSVSEYNIYLKELIKKYNIKQLGNTIKRVSFNLNKDINIDKDYKFINAIIGPELFNCSI